ncbi:hypothetical protein EV198_1254 [Roseivirga ehrenbergii]|uniref:Uncharacterized protein n=1 Tax=Roseivirga ehrenbergii (strain DSM 102268 / JCM 13514 / KCTC 12282 / NCIMB 14502 / KMM 6017) TaxID=279360 RepID=A0A150XEG8_ROSEK|nr:hypothetical protein [Roseivirga ehrenbergii]KYG77082.1 hypothetical protein MB14_02460 [Roseivirga ehrenbergii]TCL14412.1 hypothetical protein EV198_1254 [Roseivirga ehrenbergii]
MEIKYNKCLFLLRAVFALTVLSNVSSCSNEGSKESSQATGEVTLIPKDSIKIDVLSPIKIYDYDPENNLFLLGDVADGFSEMLPDGAMPKGNEVGFIIIDGSGEVLGQFNNTGDGPVNHGVGAKNNLFLDDNRIGVFTKIGFFVYDFDGNLLGRSKALNTQRTHLDIPFDISAFQNGNLALGYTTMSMKAFQNQDNPFPYMKSFRIFDLNGLLGSDDGINDHTIQNYGFPEGIADETIGGTSPRMAFNKRIGVLSVLFSKFQKLHQYSIADGSLLNVIDLKPAYFSSGNESVVDSGSPGYLDWRQGGGSLINSTYHDMVQLGDYTLIRYSSVISNTQAGQLVESGGISESEYWETVRKSTYKFYYLLIKDGSVVKQDFELVALSPQPGGEYFRSATDLRGQLIGGSDLNSLYVLYNNDYAQERDYKLIVRYELKLD